MSRLRPARAVAAFDSASVMLCSTAAALQGRGFPHLGRGRVPAAAVRATALLPGAARRAVYSLAGGAGGVPADRLGDLDVEDVAGWVASHHPRRRYPAVAIGSSNGAAVHLYTALGIPWLPQTLLVTVRHARADPDDAHRALEFGARVAEPLLAANPQISVHHMHDPNQDRLMVRWMTYLRLKRLTLGAAYERFLAEHLAPGGTILLVRDRSSWPVTRVTERHVFQFGARGGATAEEYLSGGPRVRDFLRRHGVDRDGWDPPAPDTEAPEAEWGLAPQLADDVRRWAAAHGHPVRELVLDEPDELSGPVAELYRRWYAQRGLPTDRLLVESFVLHDPIAALRSVRVPYWTLFPVRPSLDRARTYLDSTDPTRTPHCCCSPMASTPSAWPAPGTGATCWAESTCWVWTNAASPPTSRPSPATAPRCAGTGRSGPCRTSTCPSRSSTTWTSSSRRHGGGNQGVRTLTRPLRTRDDLGPIDEREGASGPVRSPAVRPRRRRVGVPV